MDDVAKVPAALVEALREAMDQIPAAPVEREGLYPTLYWAARALVDAAERPDEGERCSIHVWTRTQQERDEDKPFRCHVCGIPEPEANRLPWTPAPLSSPRRAEVAEYEDDRRRDAENLGGII